MEQQKSIYLRVKDELIQYIKHLEPNERIPSRTDLVKTFNVSRTTIDRAIYELIGEGYLNAKDGSGTYKAERPPHQSEQNGFNGWGLVMPNILMHKYPGILRGVEDISNEHDINLIACNTDNSPEKQKNYIDKLIRSDVKGIILIPVIRSPIDLSPFKRLEELQIPFIFCNRGVSGIDAPMVTSNNFYGAYIAVKHLIEMGYRRIAFLSRPVYSNVIERYHGYTAALREANLEVDENLVIFEESFDIENPGYESTKKLLQNNPKPDAIFCFIDTLAMGAYEAIIENGYKVGEDIGLVGYDNSYVCESLPVKLTSVNFDTYHIGKKAGELLLSIANGEKVPNNKMVVLDPELIIRESSRRAPTQE